MYMFKTITKKLLTTRWHVRYCLVEIFFAIQNLLSSHIMFVFCFHISKIHVGCFSFFSFSPLAPPAGQDGAPTEGAAAGEAEARPSEGRRQQHGI